MLSKNLWAVAAAAVPAMAQSMNLTALIAGDDRLSTLNTILTTYPDVASTLTSASNITVFAPTNDAFMTYLESSGFQLTDVTAELVTALLNYHVLNGTYQSANITESPQFLQTMLTNETYSNVTGGQRLSVQFEDGDVLVTSGLKSEATVVDADLAFEGGVAHVIDAVNIIPENITNTASAGNLTTFLGALAATNLTSVLQEMSDVTIFAPSNSAFADIGSALENITTEQLTTILQYHVLNGTVAYSTLIGNGTVDTLGGSSVNLTVADDAIFVDQARVVNADNLISNGVLHILDSVLNPNGTATPNPDNDNPQAGFDGASSGTVGLTSGVPVATTTVENILTTTLQVASGYPTVTVTEAVAVDTSTSSEMAAAATGAVGMVALFGGAAFAANW